MKQDKFKITDKVEIEIRRKNKMKEELKLRGEMLFELRKKDGTVIDKEVIENVIVNSGKERVAKLIGEGIDTGLTGFSYIAIGTDNTGEGASDTALGAEVKREAASVSYEANYKAVFEKTFDFGTGESYAIVEAGLFDNATETGSVMLNRKTFTAKNVDEDTDLYVKITITVS